MGRSRETGAFPLLVGNHSAEWYEQRGPLTRAVVSEMKEYKVLMGAHRKLGNLRKINFS